MKRRFHPIHLAAVAIAVGACTGAPDDRPVAPPPTGPSVPAVVAAPGLEGRSFYVSALGGDDGDGSADRPLRDPASAVAQLQPGDVLTIGAGVYPGGIEITSSGEPNRPITIRAMPGERVVIDARHVYGFRLGCGIHDVVIEGFEIKNFSEQFAGGPEVHGIAHAAGIMGRCDDLGQPAVSNSAFLNNVIHNEGELAQTGEGIWLRLSDHNLVAGNVIYDLGSSAIRLKHSAECIVFSNLVWNVGTTDGLGGGITFYCAPDTEVSFNTVVMTDAEISPAILAYDGTNPADCVTSDRSYVHGNIGLRVGESRQVMADALCVQAQNTQAVDLAIESNLWWAAGDWAPGESAPACPATAGTPVVLWGGSIVYEHGCRLPVADWRHATGQGRGDLQASPEFVDLAGREFTLGEGSPAARVAEPGSREETLLRAIGRDVPALMDLGFQF